MTAQFVREAEVRYSLTDPQLRRADCLPARRVELSTETILEAGNLVDHTQVGTEIPIVANSEEPRHPERSERFVRAVYDLVEESKDEQSRTITDYCLYRTNGEVLAVVEAKRTSRDPRVGKQQVLEYVTAIEKKQSFRPFAFMANGEDIFFWDSIDSAERHVAGFFSRENLERLLFLKQNRKPLGSIQIKESIVNRAYQIEAIRRISEAIEKKKKRKALLVMATGTGKTRTTMALIDVFLHAHAAQRVLFLADRDALVDQALTDGFKVHLPSESRTRIRTYNIDKTGRVYVSTLQTLEMCSVEARHVVPLQNSDAIQIGLTATPAEFIDRDTMKFFDCLTAEVRRSETKADVGGRRPTFLYTFDEAVKENYLADFNVYAAQTKFQRKGIKGVDLTDEDKDLLKSRGIDPDDINYEGTDSITDFGFEIAEWNAFNPNSSIRNPKSKKMYPEYGGKLVQAYGLVEVITSKMERANMIAEFGFGIAEVADVNPQSTIRHPKSKFLPVNSQIKFWQMIGRGTRSREACLHAEVCFGTQAYCSGRATHTSAHGRSSWTSASSKA